MLFGFIKKTQKTEEELRAESLPHTKKVQFETKDISFVERALDSDMTSVLDFNPVNYYADKNEYLLCVFYYSEDYSEIFMRFERVVNDVSKERSKLFSIDKELMRGILRKFGQNI